MVVLPMMSPSIERAAATAEMARNSSSREIGRQLQQQRRRDAGLTARAQRHGNQ